MLERHRSIPTSNYKLLNMVDGGSLVALAAKGNLSYAESLYNPGNFFSEVHHLTFHDEDLKIHLANDSIHVHLLKKIRIPKLGTFISSFYRAFQVVRFIRTYEVNVIRSRGVYRAGLLSILAGRVTKTPVVVSLGGDNRLAQELLGRYHLFNNRLLSFRVEEFVLRNADKVFCPNEFTRKYVLKLGVDPSKAALVPLVLEPRLFYQKGRGREIRVELGWLNEPLVLFVGRLAGDKQVDVLVETIPLILKSRPDTKFVFVGDGILRDSLSKRCKELDTPASVKFTGFQPTDRVADFIAAATIIWIPMSGFVVYEAAAAGKPIVAFDVEWHSEFIKNGKAGILVENRNINKLAKAVLALLNDPHRAAQLGEAARRKLETDFNPKVLIDREINEYLNLLEKHEN